jgi:hypothetical protein
MEKRYYTSTNWLPWLGLAFVLSTLFFGFISNGWLLAFLIAISFIPALVVALTLRGFFVIENNQIKFCYERRRGGLETEFAISIVDITTIRRIGKSIEIQFDKEDEIVTRVQKADVFVDELLQRNPRIQIVK